MPQYGQEFKGQLGMAKIVIAGHLCLDVIPEIREGISDIGALLVPGTLTEVGASVVATGGTVSNTGQSLHRLGEEVVLVAKVGNDEFGGTVRHLLQQAGEGLDEGLIVDPASHTSYTVVLSPAGVDRAFLHSPGANHSFYSDDIDDAVLEGARLFHFGYPPLMRSIYENNGAELKKIFDRMKGWGMLTSLDMVCVDPASEAGQVHWPAYLENVLPSTDIFLPSLDEILFMVDRKKYDELVAKYGENIVQGVDADLVKKTAAKLIDLGVPVVVIKLGVHGLYMQTAGSVPGQDTSWSNVSRFEATFCTDVVGTTGAGDSTIAGFLASYLRGISPEEALAAAVGTGSFCTEALDAVSGIPHWNELQARINAGWKRLPGKFTGPDMSGTHQPRIEPVETVEA
jgi:sugar/nucleoside kinase (ribokinase family)